MGSIGKCCGQLYLLICGPGWWELKATGNSGLAQIHLSYPQAAVGTVQSLRETGMAWCMERIRHLLILPVTSRKLPEPEHISKCLNYDSEHLCAHQQCTPASLAASYSSCKVFWKPFGLSYTGSGKGRGKKIHLPRSKCPCDFLDFPAW